MLLDHRGRYGRSLHSQVAYKFEVVSLISTRLWRENSRSLHSQIAYKFELASLVSWDALCKPNTLCMPISYVLWMSLHNIDVFVSFGHVDLLSTGHLHTHWSPYNEFSQMKFFLIFGMKVICLKMYHVWLEWYPKFPSLSQVHYLLYLWSWLHPNMNNLKLLKHLSGICIT